MEKDSKMFLKRSAYHVSKAHDLQSALRKSKGVDEALNRLKSIKSDYQREALLEATKTMAKNYKLYPTKKLIIFMSKMAELPNDKKLQIKKIINLKSVTHKQNNKLTSHNSTIVPPLHSKDINSNADNSTNNV